MDHETKELFNALIKEMDRMQERTNSKIDSVQTSIDAFKEENRNQHEQMMHESNSCKSNFDTVDLLLKKVIELENEVNILKEQVRKLTT